MANSENLAGDQVELRPRPSGDSATKRVEIGPNKGWTWSDVARLLYTHNPFYVISAVLVLSGIYRVFSQGDMAGRAPLLMQLLCSYALILAVAAWLVIRFGRVWEDVRTVLLSILLLFAALSVAFDKTCLDDPADGAKYLGIGFAFCVALSVGLVFRCNARLGLPVVQPEHVVRGGQRTRPRFPGLFFDTAVASSHAGGAGNRRLFAECLGAKGSGHRAPGAFRAAFCGPGASGVQQRFLDMQIDSIGAPPWWTTGALIVFYALSWLRRLPVAEPCLVATVWFSTWLGLATVDRTTLANPSLWPTAVLAVMQLALAFKYRSIGRTVLAGLFGLHSLIITDQINWLDDWLVFQHGYYTIHSAVLVFLVWMLFSDGRVAWWLRGQSAYILMVLAVLAAAIYPFIFHDVPGGARLGYQVCLVMLAIACARRNRMLVSVAAIAVSATSLATTCWETTWYGVRYTPWGRGFVWWSGGLLCLAVALTISLIKGGALRSWWWRIRKKMNRPGEIRMSKPE